MLVLIAQRWALDFKSIEVLDDVIDDVAGAIAGGLDEQSPWLKRPNIFRPKVSSTTP